MRFYRNSCCVALLIVIDFCVVHLKHCISGLMNLPNMLIIEHSPKLSCFAESEEPWWMCRIGEYLVKGQGKKCHIQQDEEFHSYTVDASIHAYSILAWTHTVHRQHSHSIVICKMRTWACELVCIKMHACILYSTVFTHMSSCRITVSFRDNRYFCVSGLFLCYSTEAQPRY